MCVAGTKRLHGRRPGYRLPRPTATRVPTCHGFWSESTGMDLAPADSMTAVTFVLALDDARPAYALVCVAARHCGLGEPASGRIDRRFLSAVQWKHVDAELRQGLPAEPLPVDSAIVAALLPIGLRRSVRVQYVTTEPVAATPEEVVARLDALFARLGDAPA